MKNVIKYFWPIALIAICFSKNLFAQCYNLFTTGTGSIWHWTNPSVTYYVNEYGSRFFSSPHNTEAIAIGRAFTAWQNVSPASIAFNAGGFDNATVANDGKNLLYWRNDNNVDSLVVASLTTWGNSYSGVLTNVDIWFNDRYYEWTDGTLVFDSNIMDIQSIATHEIGHLLGLFESDPCTDNAPTMMTKGLWTTYYKSEAESPNLGIRSLAQGDIDGLNYLYGSILRVPQIFTTIEQAISFAQSGQTILVSNGNYSISNNLTISNGVVLQVNPGVTLNFAMGSSLIVNGTLNAVGNSANRITFTRSGSSGTWGGIQFNSGSTGSLSYCNISNVSASGVGAITINNSSPTIQNCIIENNTGITYGVYVMNYGAPYLNGNVIQNNPYDAIVFDHAGGHLTNNVITASTGRASINCFNMANPNFSPVGGGLGKNLLQNGSYGIYADYYCTPNAGTSASQSSNNKLLNASALNAYASGNSSIYAKNNYWSPFPPSRIGADAGSIVYWEPYLTTPPFSIQGPELPEEKLYLSTSESFDSYWDLEMAIELKNKKEYKEAIKILKNIINNKQNRLTVSTAFVELGHIYIETKDKDVAGFIKSYLPKDEGIYSILVEI
jgi:hypothetical protein